MKNAIVPIIIICVLISCKSRKIQTQDLVFKTPKEVNYVPYFLKVYEADSLYLVKEYENSYAVLDSLFKEFIPLNTEQYKEYETYISCAYASKKEFNFKDSILKSIQNYGSNARYFKYDSLMNISFKNLKITNEEIQLSTSIYRDKLNFRLRDSIQYICRIDQEVRNGAIGYDEKMRNADSLIQIKLREIFTKYDYPHEKLIGEFYIDSVFTDLGTIFLHTNRDFRMNFLLPKVLLAVKNGLTYPENYSQSYDRFLENSGKMQLYGSYNLTREKKITEIENLKSIDSIRKSIGLPSRTYKKWRFKKKYGVEFN